MAQLSVDLYEHIVKVAMRLFIQTMLIDQWQHERQWWRLGMMTHTVDFVLTSHCVKCALRFSC